ncbi:MAG TPA: helix-turn-helix transcriptional regulator [Anaerolineae bacterium]|nr:helix-turn-helix transcriptional regulator [Anaerolineae bacterium]
MSLGETVRAIRLEQGLSQKEAAEAAGIDQSYLSMIESGQRRNPGARIVARLAKVLDVSIDELAARAGYLSNPQLADPLSQRAMRLFRRLPRWRQEDVLAQLELYLERQEVQSEERRVA